MAGALCPAAGTVRPAAGTSPVASALCHAVGTVGPVAGTIGLGSGDMSIKSVDAAIVKVTLLENYQCMLRQCMIMYESQALLQMGIVTAIVLLYFCTKMIRQ